MEVLDYIAVSLDRYGGLTGMIGAVLLLNQIEILRLPAYDSLNSDERDPLKAMVRQGHALCPRSIQVS